tara:strand:- start:3575 stop:3988 length:414 start_codon:yes stop_codon:yes gene_type:complete
VLCLCAISTKGPHHQPFLIPHELENPTRIGVIDVLTFEHLHGSGTTLGFRSGDLAHSIDCMELSESALSALNGVKLWIVDALVRDPHPTHAHLDLTLSWIERVRPRRAISSHIWPPNSIMRHSCPSFPKALFRHTTA